MIAIKKSSDLEPLAIRRGTSLEQGLFDERLQRTTVVNYNADVGVGSFLCLILTPVQAGGDLVAAILIPKADTLAAGECRT